MRQFIRGYERRGHGRCVCAIINGSAPALTDEAVFTARDVDGNGELSRVEHKLLDNPDGSPNAVMRVLDLNGSGTLSSGEFIGGVATFPASVTVDGSEDNVVARRGQKETAPEGGR